MNHETMTAAILNAKNEQGYSWKRLAEGMEMDPIWVASCAYGMNSMLEDQAKRFCSLLNLGDDVARSLQMCPHKDWGKAVPTDPLIYRLYEAVMTYGQSVKDLIHEEFGDGIMSAIDYRMHLERVEDPKGDRVVITMDGKFLPFRRW